LKYQIASKKMERIKMSRPVGSMGKFEIFSSRGLGSVGIQDSHPGVIVIQASDGAIRFD
jgi:hypothetical protein